MFGALGDIVQKAVGLEWVAPVAGAPVAPVAALPWVGVSASARNLRGLARRVASADDPVLIEGETGVGKELFARYIHALSRRWREPFVKVNCAALPSELAESELFGYAGAPLPEQKPGGFEAAGSGLILLDEIGDMDLPLQARLLEVLQDYTFRKPGSGHPVPVKARVIATTHRDLERAVEEGKFRKDLYYRLYVIGVTIPPLRERREDILPLAGFLLRRHCRYNQPVPVITPALRERLLRYSWPGNVRELENMMWRLSVLGDARLVARQLRTGTGPAGAGGPAVKLPDLPPASGLPTLGQLARDTEQMKAQAILAALNTTWWNRRKAAALLKLEYRTLLYLMKKLCIEDRLTGVAAGEKPRTVLAGSTFRR